MVQTKTIKRPSNKKIKKGTILTDLQLANHIRDLSGSTRYFHISTSPLTRANLQTVDQPLILGYNCYAGRPAGFYFGLNDSWLRFLIEFRNVTGMRFCCYLYEVKIDPMQFLTLSSVTDLKRFDRETNDYWLNMYKYDLCENLGDIPNPLRSVPFNQLFRKYKNAKSNLSLGEIYRDEKIILPTVKAVNQERKKLKMPNLSKEQLEFSRRKRWDQVAEKYDGVIFNPYIPNKYPKGWYKSFDVAQGCIWHLRSLKDFTLVAHVIQKPQNKEFIFQLDQAL